MWGRLGEGTSGPRSSTERGWRAGVSKLFRDVPDGRLFERYSRRHTAITTGQKRASPGVTGSERCEWQELAHGYDSPTSPIGTTFPTGRKERVERGLGSTSRTKWEIVSRRTQAEYEGLGETGRLKEQGG